MVQAVTQADNERKERVSGLLRSTDELIRKGDLTKALEVIRTVYNYDRKNLYARAFEERILAMIAMKEAKAMQQSVAEPVQTAIDKPTQSPIDKPTQSPIGQPLPPPVGGPMQFPISEPVPHPVGGPMQFPISEPVPHPVAESVQTAIDTPALPPIGQPLPPPVGGPMQFPISEPVPSQVRESAEQHPCSETTRTAIEATTLPDADAVMRGKAVERRTLQEQREKELEAKAREAAVGEQQREHEKLYQKLLDENREKTERIEQTQSSKELQHNHEIHIEKIKQEFQKQIDDIQRRASETETTVVLREKVKSKKRSLEAYTSIVMTLDDFNVDNSVLLQSLRSILEVTESEHAEIIRSVKIATYIKVLRLAWADGKIEEGEQVIINNLRNHYEISDDEYNGLVKRVKHELGIPDNDATILIIDDSVDILLFCEFALRTSYANVKTAGSVADALEVIRLGMPSLIICDVTMPEVGGFQFKDNIINGIYGVEIQNIPFMYISACSDDYMKNIARQQGVTKFLSKPIAKELLESSVKELLLNKQPKPMMPA